VPDVHTRLTFLGLAVGAGAASGVWTPALATPSPPKMDLAPHFPVYGLQPPSDIVYRVWRQNGFRGYTIPIEGDVESPMALSTADLRAMPQRTQTTGFWCVKGWSATGTWRGVGLRTILAMVRPMPRARFVVFSCFDTDADGRPFYESLELQEANHPESLLALDLNDRPLDVAHGGPVRLHAPTQRGYKNVKWLRRIELVSSIDHIAGGRGGYWEDRGLI
jgi:DMSO/TMAO reductase YedYZ molybdopterin-dependent catalytic subunit